MSCKHGNTALKWVRRAKIKILVLWINMPGERVKTTEGCGSGQRGGGGNLKTQRTLTRASLGSYDTLPKLRSPLKNKMG